MVYEISKVIDLPPEAIHNYHVVSGRSSQAMYAISAIKNKISDLLVRQEAPELDEGLLGVDITPSCIYVCQVENKDAGHTLTSLASVCMPGKFVGDDILKNPGLYSESLKKLIRENKIRTRKVAISLPVSSSIVRFATVALMDDSEISRAVKYGSMWKNLVGQHDAPENYSIFYQIISKNEIAGTMDILMVATRLSDINLYKNIVMNSGLTPVVIDAKGLAVHYSLKKANLYSYKPGTLLIEFGLENNYIMAMGEHGPRIFDMELTSLERAAILGFEANGNPNVLNSIIQKYINKIHAISYYYNKTEPQTAICDIFVMSSLPLIEQFMALLSDSLRCYRIKEYSMLDYLNIEEHFYIKNNHKSNISSWVGAICIAAFPWYKRSEKWIEIQQSPAFGTVYFRHENEMENISDLSSRVGNFTPCHSSNQNDKVAKCANITAMIAAMICFLLIYTSYNGLINERIELSSNDTALSSVTARYQLKTTKLAALNDMSIKLQALEQAYADIARENNQQYVISMYNYLNNVLQEGVWLREISFNAPNNIKIDGRSIDDSGAMSLLHTMNGSRMFSNMDLKHIQSIKELNAYSQNSLDMKSFYLNGNLSETLPGEYLNKPNLVAGGMGNGG